MTSGLDKPPTTPTTGDVTSNLRNIMRAPGGFSAISTSVYDIVAEASEVAAAAAAGEGVVEGAGILAAIAGLSGWWIALIVVVVALVMVVALRILESLLYHLADHFPFGFKAAEWRSFVHAIFAPIDGVENWVAGELVSIIGHVIAATYRLIRLAVIIFIGDVKIAGSTVEGAIIGRVQGEYTDLYRKYNQVEQQIASLERMVQGGMPSPSSPPPPTSQPGQPGTHTTVIYEPVPGAITDQIKHLQSVVVTIAHNMNALHSDVTSIGHDVTVDHAALVALQTSLVGVRAAQYGVESTLTEVHTVIQGVEDRISQLEPQIDGATRQLFLLRPLEQLLYLGQPGINTLKKLENDPCQCPKYPELPSDQSEALAVYEFLTNG